MQMPLKTLKVYPRTPSSLCCFSQNGSTGTLTISESFDRHTTGASPTRRQVWHFSNIILLVLVFDLPPTSHMRLEAFSKVESTLYSKRDSRNKEKQGDYGKDCKLLVDGCIVGDLVTIPYSYELENEVCQSTEVDHLKFGKPIFKAGGNKDKLLTMTKAIPSLFSRRVQIVARSRSIMVIGIAATVSQNS